jgi:hypothetical protein
MCRKREARSRRKLQDVLQGKHFRLPPLCFIPPGVNAPGYTYGTTVNVRSFPSPPS